MRALELQNLSFKELTGVAQVMSELSHSISVDPALVCPDHHDELLQALVLLHATDSE